MYDDLETYETYETSVYAGDDLDGADFDNNEERNEILDFEDEECDLDLEILEDETEDYHGSTGGADYPDFWD